MQTGYTFENVNRLKMERFHVFDQKTAMNWLDGLLQDFGRDGRALEEIRIMRYCIKNHYRIPKEIRPFFERLIRDEIVKWTEPLTKDTHPMDAIHAIDDANRYAKIHFTFS